MSQNVVTYPVIIEVPNPDEKLRPKMTANVTIDVATVRDVLRVPNAALRFRPETATARRGSSGRRRNGTTQTATQTQRAPRDRSAVRRTRGALARAQQQNGGRRLPAAA